MKRLFGLMSIIIILCLVTGILLFSRFPDKIPSHWNAKGEIDGWSSKTFIIFFMPGITMALLLFLWFLPKIDPLKRNVDKFRKYYEAFVLLIILFLCFLYILTLLAGLGMAFSMNKIIIPAIALIFFYSAILMWHSKRNWFIGIRTPWTLSDDGVWEKTNRMGSRLFAVLGAIFLIAILLPAILVLAVIGLAFIFVIFLFFYSYIMFQRIKPGRLKK